MALDIRFDQVASLGSSQRQAILALLDRHFIGVTAQGFAADLAEKTHVLRLLDDEHLLGFSTIDYRRLDDEAVLYSGDTIVSPTAWENAELGSAWSAAVFDLHIQSGGGTLWWLALTSGVRTYRYLTVCVKRYAPAQAERLDPDAEARLPDLARRRFGSAFDETLGVVRFAQPQILRGSLADVPGHIAKDPQVGFFLARNPGWRHGDELVSCCQLSEANLTAAGRLSLRRGRARWSGVP